MSTNYFSSMEQLQSLIEILSAISGVLWLVAGFILGAITKNLIGKVVSDKYDSWKEKRDHAKDLTSVIFKLELQLGHQTGDYRRPNKEVHDKSEFWIRHNSKTSWRVLSHKSIDNRTGGNVGRTSYINRGKEFFDKESRKMMTVEWVSQTDSNGVMEVAPQDIRIVLKMENLEGDIRTFTLPILRKNEPSGIKAI